MIKELRAQREQAKRCWYTARYEMQDPEAEAACLEAIQRLTLAIKELA